MNLQTRGLDEGQESERNIFPNAKVRESHSRLKVRAEISNSISEGRNSIFVSKKRILKLSRRKV